MKHDIRIKMTEEHVSSMAKSISDQFPHNLRELKRIIREKLINRELTQEELEQEIRDITDELYNLPEEDSSNAQE